MAFRAASNGAAALGLALVAGAASAQTDVSLNRAGSGARAAGMGDAFVAVSDDGTAASWNPAGLAQLRQPEFSIVYGATDRRLDMSAIRSLDGRNAFTGHGLGETTGSLDFASAALPFSIGKVPVTLQGGWHRIYQLTGEIGGQTTRLPVAAPPDPPYSADLNNRLEGGIRLFSVAAAVKVTGRLSLGTSVNFWRGDWSERTTLVTQSGGAPAAFFNGTSRDRIRGHNVSVGLLLTYPSWNVGVVHHSPFWSDYRTQGERHSTDVPVERVDIQDAHFRLPRSIGFGVAKRLHSRWTLAAAVTSDDWTDALIKDVPGFPGEYNFFDGRPSSITTSRDTVSVNLGAERLVVRDGFVVPLRIGFAWEPQGAMDPITRDPVDYHMAAAGAGYNTNSFKFDLAVQLRWASYDQSEPLSVPAVMTGAHDAVGRAGTREWRIKLSAIYRMADTDALRGFLRRIFG